MAVIIKKISNQEKDGLVKSTNSYISSQSPTGWIEDITLAIKFDEDTGIAILSAQKTLLTEAGEGNTYKLTTVAIEGDPEPAEAAAVLGKIGGRATSEAKRLAAIENGKKGGRPKGSKNKEAKIAP